MIIRTMGIENKLQGNMSDSDRSSLGISDEDRKALMVGATLAIEARYEALSRLLESGAYKNCLDIACGFTPRSLYCYKTGIDYVSLDVPAVVEQLTPFAAGMMQKTVLIRSARLLCSRFSIRTPKAFARCN